MRSLGSRPVGRGIFSLRRLRVGRERPCLPRGRGGSSAWSQMKFPAPQNWVWGRRSLRSPVPTSLGFAHRRVCKVPGSGPPSPERSPLLGCPVSHPHPAAPLERHRPEGEAAGPPPAAALPPLAQPGAFSGPEALRGRLLRLRPVTHASFPFLSSASQMAPSR